MQIRHTIADAVAVLELTGRLTVNDSQGLIREAVAEVLRGGATSVVLNLAGVQYIDSTRLGELIAAHVTLSRTGGRLTIAGTPPRVLDLLTLAGLDTIFERFETVADAVASLTRGK